MSALTTPWKKATSITTGGKPFFWVRWQDGIKLYAVWDRQVLAWAAQVDERTVDYCTTALQARRSVDNRQAHHA